MTSAPTLEAGARAAAELAGVVPPPLTGGLRERVAQAAGRLDPARAAVRGLFSGGTLCYEAQLMLERRLGPVHSNEPLRTERGLPAPDGAHVLLDLGAEEYTRGVPHPMIDLTTRLDLLRRQADDPSLAVALLDVVLGHGSADDPAGQLAPVCAELMAGDGPQVVAYVLGTEHDPQVYSRQRAALEEVGCLVPETNARAAHAAAALALRRPELVECGRERGPSAVPTAPNREEASCTPSRSPRRCTTSTCVCASSLSVTRPPASSARCARR